MADVRALADLLMRIEALELLLCVEVSGGPGPVCLQPTSMTRSWSAHLFDDEHWAQGAPILMDDIQCRLRESYEK